MKIVVTGGKDITNYLLVKEVLYELDRKEPITFLAQGGAKGVDTIAKQWADENNISNTTFYLDWNKHRKEAIDIRNREMLEIVKPDYLVAFSSGKEVDSCVSIAKELGIEVIEVKTKE